MPVPEGEYVVGRSHDAYVYVEDASVSRNHARLINNAEGFFIEDLGSSNGTAMRGAFLTTRTKVEYGSTVHVGSVPFRIDPEVSGEPEPKQAPSTRLASDPTIRRATERIPLPGESAWAPKPVAPDKLAAPEVNAGDADAEDLNAVTIREPELVAPKTWAKSVPVPPATAPTTVSTSAAVKTASPKPTPAPASRAEKMDEDAAPPAEKGRLGSIIIFLAGLGVGLLLGLIFAWIFFEMGGKPAGLP